LPSPRAPTGCALLRAALRLPARQAIELAHQLAAQRVELGVVRGPRRRRVAQAATRHQRGRRGVGLALEPAAETDEKAGHGWIVAAG
jgi:hypothetical protein